MARLKAAGAIVLGKTNMHELAFGVTSGNAAFGAVGNAHDKSFIAGGSSGGTAVAVASGMAVAGLGTDTGGSSRIPAALNGIVGFRPTGGRYPSAGITRISSTRDTIGPMAHRVADVALLDRTMAGESGQLPDVGLRGLRIGVPRGYFFDDLQREVRDSVESLLDRLDEAGVELVPADLAGIERLNEETGFPIVLFEARSLLSEYLAAHLPGRSPSDPRRFGRGPIPRTDAKRAVGRSPSPPTGGTREHLRPRLRRLVRRTTSATTRSKRSFFPPRRSPRDPCRTPPISWN